MFSCAFKGLKFEYGSFFLLNIAYLLSYISNTLLNGLIILKHHCRFRFIDVVLGSFQSSDSELCDIWITVV